MFFYDSQVPSKTDSVQPRTLVENGNRHLFVYCLSRVRAGDFAQAQRLAFELVDASKKQGDALHFYAGHILLRMAGDSQNVQPTERIVSGANTQSEILKNMMIALGDLQLGQFTNARKRWEQICQSTDTLVDMPVEIASCFSWLATAIRTESLQTTRYFESTLFELESKWSRAVSQALKIAKTFPDEVPHAYREDAWLNAIQGGGSQSSHVLRSLRWSVIVAQRLGLFGEELQTLQAWDAMTNKYEFNVPNMCPAERARLVELTNANVVSDCDSETSECQLESVLEAGVDAMLSEIHSVVEHRETVPA
jgi:hypothetical protein